MSKISLTHIFDETKVAGCLAGGLIVGNVVLQMDKKGGMLFPIAMAGGGIVGASMTSNKYLKYGLYGVSVFGLIKLINKVTVVAAPGTEGLFGFTLPEGIRSALVKYVPQLGDAENIDFSKLAGNDIVFPEYQNLTGDGTAIPYEPVAGFLGSLSEEDVMKMVA